MMRGRTSTRRASRFRRQPECERLEARQLLAATAGLSGYVLSGTQWSQPDRITYSLVPDGAVWQRGNANALNGSLDARLGSDGTWQREIARALQTWAVVANVNFVQVVDGGQAFNTPGRSQGDPRFGDIRIAGYGFGETTTLAEAHYPPPNGNTAAGDVTLNTDMAWALGQGIDLYSVLLHEFGHSLGLEHAPDSDAVMHERFQGMRSGLTTADIDGIREIYGPRRRDRFTRQGLGTSFETAVNLTPELDPTRHRLTLDGVELTSRTQTDYYRVVVPALKGATLRVTVVASGVSLLSPKVEVLDASRGVLARRARPDTWGENVGVRVEDVEAGDTLVIAVSGATRDVFAVGAYQLQVAFVGGTPIAPPQPPDHPAPPPPNRPTTPPPPPPQAPVSPSPAPTPPKPPTANPAPQPPVVVTPSPPPPPPPVVVLPDRLEPNDTFGQATPLGPLAHALIGHLTLHTPGDVDYFAMQSVVVGTYHVVSPGQLVRVFDGLGRLVGAGLSGTTWRAEQVGAPFRVAISAVNGALVPSYGVRIDVQADPLPPPPPPSAPLPPPPAPLPERWGGPRSAVPFAPRRPVAPMPVSRPSPGPFWGGLTPAPRRPVGPLPLWAGQSRGAASRLLIGRMS